MARVSIYGLKDPRDGQVYYIGKAERPRARFKKHLKDNSSNPKKAAWINALLTEAKEPELVILEKVDADDWGEAERRWIAAGREKGWPLTNIADGGPGGAGKPEAPFIEVMRPFLSPWHWARYSSFSGADQWLIARAVALVIGHYSKVAYRVFNKSDGRWYRPGIGADAGADVARGLVEAHEGFGPVSYDFMLRSVDHSADLLVEQLALVTQRG